LFSSVGDSGHGYRVHKSVMDEREHKIPEISLKNERIIPNNVENLWNAIICISK